MSLNLNLDSVVVKTQKVQKLSKEELDNLYDEIMFDDAVEESQENYYDEATFIKVCEFARGIKNSKDPEAVIAFLKRDPNFDAAFGNGDVYQNLINYLNESNEHLGQDFLRWGIDGMIAGAILARIKRIYTYLSNVTAGTIDSDKMDKWYARSLYLPNYDKFVRILQALNVLGDAIKKFASDPKAEIAPVISALKSLGVDCKYNGDVGKIVTVDWGAVGGSLLGALVGALGASLGIPFLRIPGVVVGGHMGSAQGGKLADRGWTPEKLVKAASDMTKLIDQLEQLKASDKSVPYEANDRQAKKRFINRAVDVYTHTIKNVGRGLVAAIKHVS